MIIEYRDSGVVLTQLRTLLNLMKYFLIPLLCLCLVGCGSDSSSFSGVWRGTFTSFENECPFTLVGNLDYLFPLTVNEDADGVFTVTASDGSVAVGGQGDGETISFLASSPNFGNYGSIGNYACSSLSTVRFLTAGDSSSKISLVIAFTACSLPGASDPIADCHATYRWDGERL